MDEVNEAVEQSQQGKPGSVRVAVVYKYPVFRDLIAHVLSKSGICIAAMIELKDLESTSFKTIKPDVIVVYDPDASSLISDVVNSALLDPERGYGSKVICVGMEDEMVVLVKSVVVKPTVESLISCVLDLSPAVAVNTGS